MNRDVFCTITFLLSIDVVDIRPNTSRRGGIDEHVFAAMLAHVILPGTRHRKMTSHDRLPRQTSRITLILLDALIHHHVQRYSK